MKGIKNFTANINIIYWIVTVILVVTAAFAIYFSHEWLIKHPFTSITTIIALFGSIVTLKDISNRFQKYLLKVKVILKNSQISLSFNSHFKGDEISKSKFDELKKLLKSLGNDSNIIYENAYELSISIDGVLLQCSFREYDNEEIYSYKEKYGEIIIFIPQYHAPYVEATYLLENKLLPIVTEIKSQIGYCDEQYTFDVHFMKKHPFIGLYVNELRGKHNVSFNLDFIEKPIIDGLSVESSTKISLKKLSLHTKNLTNLDRLIKKHLFLSGG